MYWPRDDPYFSRLQKRESHGEMIMHEYRISRRNPEND